MTTPTDPLALLPLLPVIPDLDGLLEDDTCEPLDAQTDNPPAPAGDDSPVVSVPYGEAPLIAQIKRFVTRAESGLAPPRSVSRKINPAAGGVAVHYGGPAQRLRSEDAAVGRLRDWQSYHRGKGWADIAYTLGVDDWGNAYACRGAGVRSAANGTDAANSAYYAIVWLGGKGEIPTAAARNAIAWGVHQLRQAGAGDRVRPHLLFRDTECPGDYLVTLAEQLDRQPVLLPSTGDWNPGVTGHPHPTPLVQLRPRPGTRNDPAAVKDLQGHLNAWRRNRRLSQHLPTNGNFDEWTHIALTTFQRAYGLIPDGVCGPKTWAAVHRISKGSAVH